MLRNTFSTDSTDFREGQSRNVLATTNETCPYVNLRCSLDGLVVATCFCSEEKGEGVKTRLLVSLSRKKKITSSFLTRTQR